LQLDALEAAGCLKVYKDTATGTKADRPQWNLCLADLRPGDTLVIWKIDRLGRNLRDLIDIVTTLDARGVGVQSLTNGIVDTTTSRQARLRHVRVDGRIRSCPDQGAHPGRTDRRPGPRPHRRPQVKDDPALIGKAQRMYDARQFTMAEIAASCGVTPMTIYRHIRTDNVTTH